MSLCKNKSTVETMVTVAKKDGQEQRKSKRKNNKEREWEKKERREELTKGEYAFWERETCLYEDHVELSDVHFFFLLIQHKNVY